MTVPHVIPKRVRPGGVCATCGRVSRAAKGADCKSAGLRLRRFESYLSHHLESSNGFLKRLFKDSSILSHISSQPLLNNINESQVLYFCRSDMMVTWRIRGRSGVRCALVPPSGRLWKRIHGLRWAIGGG